MDFSISCVDDPLMLSTLSSCPVVYEVPLFTRREVSLAAGRTFLLMARVSSIVCRAWDLFVAGFVLFNPPAASSSSSSASTSLYGLSSSGVPM